ncbi:MAG: class I SAM-dependent methyltransferase [Chloroflexi bacterium]|nr:class I SAM-dependent methyltransferase [Chloroflexota bacterium]
MQAQQKQQEWLYQWERFADQETFLFLDWIQPRTLDDFRGKRVLDAGCGPGHHMRLIAPVAEHITGMDLNTAALARTTLADLPNVTLIEDDIARHRPAQPFDVVYSIGVVDHTDAPDETFENLKNMTAAGGLVIVWVWSHEGNGLMWGLIEPLRKLLLSQANRTLVEWLARLLTFVLYPIVHTLYRLPATMLPYYAYFQNFRKLSFERNALNVFDKLNAPYTEFISRERIERWFNARDFEDVSITFYRGVSWCASGRKRSPHVE